MPETLWTVGPFTATRSVVHSLSELPPGMVGWKKPETAPSILVMANGQRVAEYSGPFMERDAESLRQSLMELSTRVTAISPVDSSRPL